MENEVKVKKKKSIFKRWWFWVIIVIVFFIVIGFSGTETENHPQIDTDTQSTENSQTTNIADNIEVITYAQLAIKDFYPDAKFSNYFKDDYNVVEQHPRYKVEGSCTLNNGSTSEKFYVILEFNNNNLTEYTLKHVQVGNTTLIDN